jgi:hypothetical protein
VEKENLQLLPLVPASEAIFMASSIPNDFSPVIDVEKDEN